MVNMKVGAYGTMMEALNSAVDAHAQVRQQVAQHAENHAQRRDQRRRHLEVLHAAEKLTNTQGAK